MGVKMDAYAPKKTQIKADEKDKQKRSIYFAHNKKVKIPPAELI